MVGTFVRRLFWLTFVVTNEVILQSSNAALNKFTDLTAGGVWRQARSDMLNAFPHALATLCDVWTSLQKGEPNLPVGNSVVFIPNKFCYFNLFFTFQLVTNFCPIFCTEFLSEKFTKSKKLYE